MFSHNLRVAALFCGLSRTHTAESYRRVEVGVPSWSHCGPGELEKGEKGVKGEVSVGESSPAASWAGLPHTARRSRLKRWCRWNAVARKSPARLEASSPAIRAANSYQREAQGAEELCLEGV